MQSWLEVAILTRLSSEHCTPLHTYTLALVCHAGDLHVECFPFTRMSVLHSQHGLDRLKTKVCQPPGFNNLDLGPMLVLKSSQKILHCPQEDQLPAAEHPM